MATPDEITGQHPLPRAEPSGGWRRDILTWILAAALGGGGGLLTGGAADGARTGQQITDLERRVSAIEEAQGSISAIRQDLAALSATVTTQNAEVARRLGRIEDRLERVPR